MLLLIHYSLNLLIVGCRHFSLAKIRLYSGVVDDRLYFYIFVFKTVITVCRLTVRYVASQQCMGDGYTVGDSDVILFHIYASWFLPPYCR